MNADYEDFDKPTTRTPEENLWYTVLYTAVLDYKAGRSSAKWFFHSQSFETLCRLLELSTTAIRERLGIELQMPVQAAPGVDGAMTPPKPRKRLGRPPRDPNAPPRPKYVPKVRQNAVELQLIPTMETI